MWRILVRWRLSILAILGKILSHCVINHTTSEVNDTIARCPNVTWESYVSLVLTNWSVFSTQLLISSITHVIWGSMLHMFGCLSLHFLTMSICWHIYTWGVNTPTYDAHFFLKKLRYYFITLNKYLLTIYTKLRPRLARWCWSV